MTTLMNPDQVVETDVTTHRAYKDAVNVQDACNPTGITNSFKDATIAARNDLETANAGFAGTFYTRHHPIVVLFASKMHELCGLGLSDHTRYGLAYRLAQEVSKGSLRVGTAEYAVALSAYYRDFYQIGRLMQILINGNLGVVRYYGHGLPLGLLLNAGGGTPIDQAVASGKWWALDNGAFGKTDPALFWRWVGQIGTTPGALDRLLFVVPPDVPFSAAGSLVMLDGWWRSFANEEIPIAFVGQDGLTRAMWRGWAGLCSCFFIGGTTAWKLGPVARMYAALAKRRGMHVHMGRVNSVKRLAYAMSIGCDSVDGTGFTKYSASHLPRVKRTLFPGYLDMPPLIDPRFLGFGSTP